jgi:AcrR family transcriptional regulator
MSIAAHPRLGAHDRILEAAYELFTHRRIRDVGINEVIARAEVNKATFYSHFASKDDLILAFLELREQRATNDWLEAETRGRADTPEEQLLALFDLFDEWFADPDFESCPFIHVLLEMGPDHPIGRASIEHLKKVRLLVCRLAEEAGLRDPNTFARSFHILMKGSIVSAVEGDLAAAQPARAVARMLIEHHRQPAARAT